ncbi:hypothetical protein SCHIN_v1c09480 [Spiroplasma chinense]|uniref:Lipoprotein n=1 Tax=Spiroplasma chinense TaxID=216932 RepID=A0A5B9Y520_9MOLU|nr:lipoprotein [Spiroplasma chinense]QEH62141.1 hypothetical protein SCHIN_v1c09480 [Spiroplasma chinense]
MKKLITLLGSLSLTASASSMVVACGTTYDIKDDGNSVIVKFISSIDGHVQLSSADILWKLINETGPSNRETFLTDILKLINTSILANNEKNFSGEDSILKDSDVYQNKGLAEALKTKWSTLNRAVDLQIQREKDALKRANGSKWEKKWKQQLVDKFSVYQNDTDDMDLALLETKYKADILLSDASNNTTKGLLDVLLNTDSYGVTWTTAQTTLQKLNRLKSLVDDNDAFQAAYEADELAIQQIENAQKENTSDWVNTTEYKIDEAKKIVKEADVDKIEFDTPEDINAWASLGSETRSGMLSDSQRFFLEKFYETKAPLAISEVTIGYSTNGKFDDGISIDDFSGDNNVDLDDNNELLTWLGTETNANWTLGMRNNTLITSKSSKASVKKYDKLLTLNSSDFSDTLRTVVYDYILGGKAGAKVTDIKSIVENLDRKATGTDNFYGTFGDGNGKLVYVDTDGIHLVSIDGYDLLKDHFTVASKPEDNGNGNLAELKAFHDFHNLTDAEKIGVLSRGTMMNDLNSDVSNDYLRFLVNNSLLKGISDSPYDFDIMSEVKDWAKISSSTDSETYWISAVFDYFRQITTKEDNKSLVSQFIKFGVENPSNTDANNISLAMEDWVIRKIETVQTSYRIAPIVKFTDMFVNWGKTITANTATGYPKKLITNDKFTGDALQEALPEIWKTTKDGTRSINPETAFYYNYNNAYKGGVL